MFRFLVWYSSVTCIIFALDSADQEWPSSLALHVPSDRVFKAQVEPLVREALHNPQRPELIFLSSEIP